MRALAWLCVLYALPAGATDLVGRVVPPYPDDLREQVGTCVTGSDDVAEVCDWSIATLVDAAGTRRWVIAGRNAGDDGARARFRITDVIAHPPIGRDFDLQVGTCRVDGVEDDHVAAVVRVDFDREFWGEARWARRLDVNSGRLLEVDPARVDCFNIAD